MNNAYLLIISNMKSEEKYVTRTRKIIRVTTAS